MSATPPDHITSLKQELEKANVLLRQFKGTSCEEYYTKRQQLSQVSFDQANKDWHEQQRASNLNRRERIREMYALGSFGDPEQIRKLLFFLSSAVLHPEDLKEISFSFNSRSG